MSDWMHAHRYTMTWHCLKPSDPIDVPHFPTKKTHPEEEERDEAKKQYANAKQLYNEQMEELKKMERALSDLE